MTPYVKLQQHVIQVLRSLLEKDEGLLKRWVSVCRLQGSLGKADQQKLENDYFLRLPEDSWVPERLPKIILEQVDDSGPKITIRNILGSLLYRHLPYGIAEYKMRKGDGVCCLRTEALAQPAALVPGDVLATGERVLSDPREGGNGSVLICIGEEDGDKYQTWLSLPARIPIALKGKRSASKK